jgi:hypothetical protein
MMSTVVAAAEATALACERAKSSRRGWSDWDCVVAYCERNAIAFIPRFPLGARKVAGDVLNQTAQAHGASPTQVA